MVEIKPLPVINQPDVELFVATLKEFQEALARETGIPANILCGDNRPEYREIQKALDHITGMIVDRMRLYYSPVVEIN